MSRPSLRGRLKANAVVLVRFLNSPSTRKDNSVPPAMNPCHFKLSTQMSGYSSSLQRILNRLHPVA